MTPDPELQKQIETYRLMTGMERLAYSFRLNDLERYRERCHIYHQHPDWDDRQVEREVIRMFGLRAGIPEELLPHPDDVEPIIVTQKHEKNPR